MPRYDWRNRRRSRFLGIGIVAALALVLAAMKIAVDVFGR